MADFNLYAMGMLAVHLLLMGAAITYHILNRKTDIGIPRVFQSLMVFVSARKATSYQYKITFTFGCPSYNYDGAGTLITYAFLDANGIATESRIPSLIVSDVCMTYAVVNLKRNNKLAKENFDRLRMVLTRRDGKSARLYLYNIIVEDGSQNRGGSPSVVYPIRQWVTRSSRLYDLDPGLGPNPGQEKSHVSLPQVEDHEYSFFLILASSLSTLTCLYLPFVHKEDVFHAALSVAAGTLVGLLVLSVTVFTFRSLLIRRQAEYAFGERKDTSSSEKGNTGHRGVFRRFNRKRIRCFVTLLIISLAAIVAVVIESFHMTGWPLNSWLVASGLADLLVIAFFLLVTRRNLYTLMSKKCAKFFARKRKAERLAQRYSSPPEMQIRVASTIRDDSVNDPDSMILVENNSSKSTTGSKKSKKKYPAPKPPTGGSQALSAVTSASTTGQQPQSSLLSSKADTKALPLPPTLAEAAASSTGGGSQSTTGSSAGSSEAKGGKDAHERKKSASKEVPKSVASKSVAPKSVAHKDKDKDAANKRQKSKDHSKDKKEPEGKKEGKKDHPAHPVHHPKITAPVSDVPSASIPNALLSDMTASISK